MSATPENTPNKPNRSVASLIKTQSIANPDQYLHHRELEIEQWRDYWKTKQEQYFEESFDSNAPSVVEVSQVRRFLNQFLLPKLEEIKQWPTEAKTEAIRFMIPFNSEGGIQDFMLHFFQVANRDGKLEYVGRSHFEKEIHILYDIYKIKKTMECLDVMRRNLGTPKDFPSRFPQAQKTQVLDQLREVLKVLFRYTIKPEHQKEIFQSISLDYISGERVMERREKNLFYCYPHVIEKYDYRNLIFLMYFREGMVTKVGSSTQELRYNYIHFEVLKQEYLSHWLESKLKNNPAKQQVYETHEVDGRTIAAWLKEDPSQEIPLLQKLPANVFNNLVAQVDEKVPDDLKTEVSPLSEKHGEMAKFKNSTQEAAKFAKSPLDKLKAFFSKKAASQPPKEAPKPSPAPAPKAPEPTAPPPPPEPVLKITGQNAKQVPMPFLCQSATQYTARLNALKSKMAGEYNTLGKLVTKLMATFGENGTVRRRTPKHDWTVPYLIQYVLPDSSTDYLFVLGGEAKMKAKGMQYTAGDEYVYTPYVVLAAATQNEKWGKPTDERQVNGRTFYEYEVTHPEVRNKMVEFMKLILQKEFPSGL